MRKFIFIAAVILCIAAVPRAIEAVNGNFVFGFDQGKHWLQGKEIVIDHKYSLIGDEVGGKGGFFQAPGFNYLMAFMYAIFSGHPYGSLFCMVLFGIGTVALSLILFEKIFGKRSSLFIGLLIAISPSMIAQSRFEWPPFIIPFITVVFLYYLYRVVSGKWKDIFWVFFMLGLMANFEIATAGSLVVAMFIIILTYTIYKNLPCIPVMSRVFIGFILPIISLIIFDFRHNFLNAKGIIELLMSGNADNKIKYTLQVIASAHFAIFQVNFFGGFETFPFSSVVLLVIFLFSLGMYLTDKTISRVSKEYMVIICSIAPIIFLEFLIYKNTLWEWWLLELLVIYCVIGGILLSYVWRKHVVFKICVILLLLFQLTSFKDRTMRFYKSDLYDYGGTQKILGKMDAIEYIFNDAGDSKIGILVFSPPVYTYPYDFLIWWLGTTKYGYVPHREKKGIFYLLIEPDGSKLDSYQGWIDTVVKTGNILFETTLPSGFIIQKRVAQ